MCQDRLTRGHPLLPILPARAATTTPTDFFILEALAQVSEEEGVPGGVGARRESE